MEKDSNLIDRRKSASYRTKPNYWYKQGISLISFSLLLSMVQGQTISSRPEFTISLGSSFPVSKFGSDVLNKESGFARTGLSLAFSYRKLIGKKFGYIISLHGQRNGLNTTGLEEGFNHSTFNNGLFVGPYPGAPPPGAGKKYPNWKFEEDAWYFASLMGGGYGEFPISNQEFAINIKLQMGLAYLSSPKVEGKSETDTASAYLKQNSASGFGFAYLVGGGLKYKLNAKVRLLLEIDFQGSSAIKLKDIKSEMLTMTLLDGNPTSMTQATRKSDGKQSVQAVNLRLGLSFNF